MMPTVPDPRTFDHLPEQFDRFGQLRGADLAAFLRDRLPQSSPGRAVDLGCGTGRHVGLLADRYREVLAVDVSAPMLEFARSRHGKPNIVYQQRDLQTVHPDTDGTFELVISVNTLHHVADLPHTLTQLCGLLAPNGQAILVDVVAAPQILGEDGLVPRSWFVEEALRAFAEGGRRAAAMLSRQPQVGSRQLAEAFELLALSLDPGWLEHVTTDRLLTPAQFDEVYQRAFPGGIITALHNLRAIHYGQTAKDAAG